ncbi:WD and tetratricopeptide repeats protein 1-like isoform X2 [Venturia canescens]|nr:WD and tetratricopeptide repeats protein 1-like isoform X2 [Venturia canescens]
MEKHTLDNDVAQFSFAFIQHLPTKMDTYFGCKPPIPKLIDLVREREIRESTARILTSKRNVTRDLVYRLGLERELEGHQGCVNCLDWSDTGEILASASDDMHIFLWNPFLHKKICSFNTGHSGNIFSVNFMPKSNNNIVASGAADSKVKVFNLTLSEVLHACSCHGDRVKRLATAENTPHLFWSAAEDGLVLQHDLRAPHTCSADDKAILIDLIAHIGRDAEAKCVAVNPMRSELVAVGANDPYIRMYDRRMIKVSQPTVEIFATSDTAPADPRMREKGHSDENIPFDCAQYFISGHLLCRPVNNLRTYAATYVKFSQDGNELLVNMGNEQVYLFDLINARYNKLLYIPRLDPSGSVDDSAHIKQLLRSSLYGTVSDNTKDYPALNVKDLPQHAEELKLEANNKFQTKNYLAAINLYNKALEYCPTASVLYGNRAAALMKRHWDGDDYAALRDCQTTLLLDPEHVKAHFRLSRCFLELHRPDEAWRVVIDFITKFPDYSSNSALRALKKDIVNAIEANKQGSSYAHGQTLSMYETAWRLRTIDYKFRYCGHSNTTTDIKEANFFGSDGQYIIAGSDDANIFIWDRYTTNIVKIIAGDSRIVNCIQPHPSACLLATSGIDPVIRLWSPLPEDDKPNVRIVSDPDGAARMNQIRMYSDPIALMMMNISNNAARESSQLYEEESEAEDQNDPLYFHR